ncbi:MAG: hypothetical protein IKD58_07445 [Loktanella sp.]|nr:hypothetical protein [Loktanella sp.]
MHHIKTHGPIGATLRLRAHAEEHHDIAPIKTFNTEGLINDDVLDYCARHGLTIAWLLTGKSPAYN